AQADVANLSQMNLNLQNEIVAERQAEIALREGEKKTHSILFHFEGREKKEAELQNLQDEKLTVLKDQTEITQIDSRIKELILKKSSIDRMVPYDGEYVSLTGFGVATLNDLNVRNYRVADNEFSDFIEETKQTVNELQSIARSAGSYEAFLRNYVFGAFPRADFTQLWNVSIGLAKLQGDPNQISQRFLLALKILQHFKSTSDNKIMAAEILTSLKMNPSQTASSSDNNSDLQDLNKSLKSLDHDLRHHAHVPKELSAGIAAVIMYGRRFDGTYPTDRFTEFSKMTRSHESAAILSVLNVPTDQLAGRFQSFRSMFNMWGFRESEDTELSSAYLSLSGFGPDDVKT